MTYSEIEQNIRSKKYENRDPYPERAPVIDGQPAETKEEFQARRAEWKKGDYAACEQFSQDIREYANTELNVSLTDSQFKAIYGRAWESGHSSGYDEVLLDFDALLDIVKLFV